MRRGSRQETSGKSLGRPCAAACPAVAWAARPGRWWSGRAARRALGLPAASLGWVREVYLRGYHLPWVFARSVASKSALEAGGLNMDALGTRSLGELLFSDQAFERGPLQVCRYPRDWLPDADRADNLWGRRSRFVRGSLSVLVAEVFLPNLWAAVSARPETN